MFNIIQVLTMEEVTPTEESLTTAVSKEILNTSVDLGIQYAELNLDQIFEEGIIKQIPVVKSIYAVGKLGLSIRERHFIKKFLVFLKEFRTHEISEAKLNDFKYMFDTDDRYKDKVTEHLMIYIDTFLNIQKPMVLANLFRNYVEGIYDWEHFVLLSDCLNACNPQSFIFLQKLSKHDFKIPEPREENHEHTKLFKELSDFKNEVLLSSAGMGGDQSTWSSWYQVSDLGIDLFNYGIKNAIE